MQEHHGQAGNTETDSDDRKPPVMYSPPANRVFDGISEKSRSGNAMESAFRDGIESDGITGPGFQAENMHAMP